MTFLLLIMLVQPLSDAISDVLGDVNNDGHILKMEIFLPEWLSFKSSTRTFTGRPTTNDIGNIRIKVVVAYDALFVSAHDIFIYSSIFMITTFISSIKNAF